MTVEAPVRTLQDWLDELVAAQSADWFDVANRAIRAGGYTTSPVVCTKCNPDITMTFVAAVRHLRQTEQAWLEQHPESRHPGAARLHAVGDLVSSTSQLPPKLDWTTTPCHSCHQPVVWAVTKAGGKRMPVNPDPDPAGNIVLAMAPGGTYADPPLAVFLASRDAEHTNTSPDQLHMSHFATCPQANSWRRR